MTHGINRSARFAAGVAHTTDDEEPSGRLLWRTVGPWRYALGDFGTIQGYLGLSPWIVRVHRRTLGMFNTLDEARRAIERVALQRRYEIVD